MNTTASPFPSEWELAGLLPRYRMLRLISETRMSQVHLAAEPALHNRHVAVKVLLPDLANEPQFRRRFVQEVRIAATLRHHNIISIIATTEPGDELLYLVMPYIEGPTLATLLRRTGPLELHRTIRIIRQLAAALDHAHAHGVVHRDVKPANVFLSGVDEHVYLGDFGIAVEANGERLTGAWQPVPGTVGYMAPEQFDVFGPGYADRRVDVYGLGAVLHECLTGRPPFDLRDTAAVRASQRAGDPPPVSAARRDLPRAVDAVVRRALSPDPAARHGTCGELAADLERAAGGARLTRPGGPGTRPRPDRRAAIVVALAVALVAGAIAVAVPLLTRSASTAPSAAQLARVPPPLRGDCAVDAPATGFPGATGVLTCSAAGQSVQLSLFDQADTMDGAYTAAISRSGVPGGTGDCTLAIGAEQRYPSVGKETGRVLCYSRDGSTTFVWSNYATRTIALANRGGGADLGLEPLWSQWVGLAPFPTNEESALMSLVGQPNCHRSPAGDLDAYRDMVAAVDCSPSDTGVNTVSYYQFAAVAGLTNAQNGQVAKVAAPPGVDCIRGTAPGFLGDSRLDLRSVDMGDLLCYQNGHKEPVMQWSLEPLRLLVRATGSDPAALASWWRGDFGFTAPASALAAAANRLATPAFPTAPERALLAHVPVASRVGCMRPSRQQVMKNVGAASVSAAVVCGPTRGASIVFYYQLADAPSTAAVYAPAMIGGPDCASQPAGFAGDAPYARPGAAGRLGCGKNPNGPYLIWTDDALNIVVMAFSGADPGPLLDWWRTDAGPS